MSLAVLIHLMDGMRQAASYVWQKRPAQACMLCGSFHGSHLVESM